MPLLEVIRTEERLKLLRKNLNMNQKDFASSLGLGQSTWAMIEIGKRNLSDRHIKTICAVYNVNEVWLRTGTGEMFVVHKDETAAIISDLLESINNKSYDFILDVLKVYQTLPSANQDVIKNFCQQLIKERENRKE